MITASQPTADQVRLELARILESSDFVASDSISTFLRYVVEETLTGRKDEIKGYTIAVRAFGRETSFDPQTDTLVRTHARRLRRALERYYLTEGADNPVHIELNAGSYVPDFIMIPPAKKEPPPAASPVWRPPGTLGSIWVSPLVAVNHGELTLPMAIVLSETIKVALSAYPMFKTYGDRFEMEDNNDPAIPTAASDLPDYVLEGTVADRAGVLSVNVRLSQYPNGQILWAHRFERDPEQHLSLFEQTVATQTSAMIADDLGAITRSRLASFLTQLTSAPEISDPALAYYHATSTMSLESCQRACVGLEYSLYQNPSDPTTNAMLADVLTNLYLLHGEDEATLHRAAVLTRRVQTMNPHCTLLDQLQMKLCRARACQTFPQWVERAVGRAPHRPTVLANAGALLALSGNWARGMELIAQAEQLNPHLPGWVQYAPFLYHYSHDDYEQALSTALTFNTPGLAWDPLLRAAVFGQLGMATGVEMAWEELYAHLQPSRAELNKRLKRLLRDESLVESILDGLAKAKALIQPGRNDTPLLDQDTAGYWSRCYSPHGPAGNTANNLLNTRHLVALGNQHLPA